MGCYLAAAIATKIEIYNKQKEKVDIKDLEIIRKHLCRYFNLDFYELTNNKEDNSIVLKIKKDMLENNIHDCLKNFSQLIKPTILRDLDLNNIEDFNQENYPITYEYQESIVENRYGLCYEESIFPPATQFGDPFWLYWDCDLLGYNEKYRIWITAENIWIDYNKFASEDETALLFIMNNMKNLYFKNPLAKNIFFYIDG